jgi:hypothetical protein
MRLLVISFALIGLWAVDVHAQVQQFPYDAIIDADDVDVLSGPGRRYYATGKLKRGTRVQVRRHDPGAWYMISPPADSFSWIPADAVKRQSDPRIGVLTQPNVSVRIGSTLSDDHEIEQVKLSIGDRVEIIGEGRIQGSAGSIAMLKIKPPAGEWRWVSGQFVTPSDPVLRAQHDHDPFAIPSQAKTAPSPEEKTATGEPKAEPSKRESALAEQTEQLAPNAAVAKTVVDAEAQGADEAALEALDQQFAAMVDLEPDQWNLDALEQNYVALQEQAASDAMAGHVRLRLQAVARYRSMQAKYLDFIQLTSETSRREAELAAMMGQPGSAAAFNVQVAQPGPQFQQSQSVEIMAERFESGPSLPIQMQSGVESVEPEQVIHAAAASQHEGWTSAHPVQAPAMPPRSAMTFAQAGPAPQATGIIQRAPYMHRGAPAHVLLAPDGRVIAFLHAQPGVNLDRYVGQPLSVAGQRMHRPDLRADLIVVHGLTPMRWTR